MDLVHIVSRLWFHGFTWGVFLYSHPLTYYLCLDKKHYLTPLYVKNVTESSLNAFSPFHLSPCPSVGTLHCMYKCFPVYVLFLEKLFIS